MARKTSDWKETTRTSLTGGNQPIKVKAFQPESRGLEFFHHGLIPTRKPSVGHDLLPKDDVLRERGEKRLAYDPPPKPYVLNIQLFGTCMNYLLQHCVTSFRSTGVVEKTRVRDRFANHALTSMLFSPLVPSVARISVFVVNKMTRILTKH